MAYAMDPKSRVVRNGSRLNKIVLVRLDPQDLSEKARELAAEGVVAYSAVCTHTGCDVSGWKADKGVLLCSCHYSEYDPKSDARVVAGPAPRPLPALPLRVADGVLSAAGGFIGRVGFQRV
jgi:Rieske Fe-S protein